MSSGDQKNEWPECMGMTGEEAKALIESEAPHLSEVVIINARDPVTMDFRMDRVRVRVINNEVVVVPKVG
eukprot:CAMPEP_0116843794 /NCGR_PEP_ID=MMETSP0418-20121206/12296_1 /TAXON_ID=1158023 /ORGANISM="Astrosyne radiata, Strain 13vi08-1A" /LENGTH=69 /DNA_ID=CAMNT_0004474607 /DNA_START=161 /DNA_END=373 /DNA_ORIENTATION=-